MAIFFFARRGRIRLDAINLHHSLSLWESSSPYGSPRSWWFHRWWLRLISRSSSAGHFITSCAWLSNRLYNEHWKAIRSINRKMARAALGSSIIGGTIVEWASWPRRLQYRAFICLMKKGVFKYHGDMAASQAISNKRPQTLWKSSW